MRTCREVAVDSSLVPKSNLTTVRKIFLVLRNPETSFLSCSKRNFLSSNESLMLLLLDSLGVDGEADEDVANAVAIVIPKIKVSVKTFMALCVRRKREEQDEDDEDNCSYRLHQLSDALV